VTKPNYEQIGKLIDTLIDLKKLARENEQILLITETVSRDLFIITNQDRVGLIGVNVDGSISTYKVDVKKWVWAENEGFTPAEILSKLLADILLTCSFKDFKKHIIFSL
jgi:hypothetical protein